MVDDGFNLKLNVVAGPQRPYNKNSVQFRFALGASHEMLLLSYSISNHYLKVPCEMQLLPRDTSVKYFSGNILLHHGRYITQVTFLFRELLAEAEDTLLRFCKQTGKGAIGLVLIIVCWTSMAKQADSPPVSIYTVEHTCTNL